MNNRLSFVKTTVVGGFVFLIPAVNVVIALGKVIGAMKAMAKALSPLFGIESLMGVKCPRLIYQSRCEFSVDFRFQRG